MRTHLLLLPFALAALGYSAPAIGQNADPAAVRAAAQAGDAEAAYAYALDLLYPQSGEADAASARSWLSFAAENGVTAAQTQLGLLYRDGWGGPADPAAAQHAFSRAAAAGDQGAILALAEMEIFDLPGQAPTGITRLNALTRQAETAAPAYLLLAEAYLFGPEDVWDAAAALAAARSALQRDPGLSEARYIVGIGLMEGAGGAPDPAGAIAAWRDAATAGDVLSMLALGDVLSEPGTAYSDPATALAYFQLAQSYGEAELDDEIAALNASLTASERQRAAQVLASLSRP